jgi:hypothetical protein
VGPVARSFGKPPPLLFIARLVIARPLLKTGAFGRQRHDEKRRDEPPSQRTSRVNRERPGRRTPHTMRLFATLLCVIGALPVVASDVQAEQARAMLQEILEHIPGVDQESIDAVGDASCPPGADGGPCESRRCAARPAHACYSLVSSLRVDDL